MFGLLLAIGALSAQTTAQTHILRSMGVANYPPLAYAARTQGTLKLSVKLKESRALFRCEEHFPSFPELKMTAKRCTILFPEPASA